MSEFITPDLIAKAPTFCDALGLEPGTFGRFLVARDAALASQQKEHEELMCQSLEEEIAWAQ